MNNFEKKVRIIAHTVVKLSKYKPWGKAVNPKIVYIIDGTNYAGGLSDRIRQILGVYAICKSRGYEFKLIANYPFTLSNYLKPRYDWILNDEDFSRNIFYDKPIYLGFRSKEKYKDLITLNHKQLHLFASVQWGFICDYGFSIKQLFWELFEPASQIREYIQECKKKQKSWDGLVFRFQDLLDDFNEDHNAQYMKIKLSSAEKNDLIKKCITYIEDFTALSKNSILICSDSITFLNIAKNIPGVFIIPGNLTHMEYSKSDDFDLHLKSFLDFFMLSESCSIKSVGTKIMYPSDFPLLAANINNVPFERIYLEYFN